VLGNPPWERGKIQKKEWFAARDEKIAAAATASIRDRMIEALATSVDDEGRPNEGDRQLYVEYQFDQRESKGQVTMYRKSGLFPRTGFGDVNTYAVFAEKARQLIGPEGMAGLVLPTGIATDKTTAAFFSDLVETRQMVAALAFSGGSQPVSVQSVHDGGSRPRRALPSRATCLPRAATGSAGRAGVYAGRGGIQADQSEYEDGSGM
jgi:hypothetical protein